MSLNHAKAKRVINCHPWIGSYPSVYQPCECHMVGIRHSVLHIPTIHFLFTSHSSVSDAQECLPFKSRPSAACTILAMSFLCLTSSSQSLAVSLFTVPPCCHPHHTLHCESQTCPLCPIRQCATLTITWNMVHRHA